MSTSFSLVCGWVGFLAGAISGAILGLFFLKPNWLGGYGSIPRRMLRLGHISFFGIGLINIMYALSAEHLGIKSEIGGYCFLVALVSMPTLCFLTAWKTEFQRAFFIPVGAVILGVLTLLKGTL